MPKAFLIRKKISARELYLSSTQWRPVTPPPSPDDDDAAKDQPLNLTANGPRSPVTSSTSAAAAQPAPAHAQSPQRVTSSSTAVVSPRYHPVYSAVDHHARGNPMLSSPSSGIGSDNELDLSMKGTCQPRACVAISALIVRCIGVRYADPVNGHRALPLNYHKSSEARFGSGSCSPHSTAAGKQRASCKTMAVARSVRRP